jgi:hypothetical protein
VQAGPKHPSRPRLGQIVRAFKSLSAIAVNRLLDRAGQPLWQRNYYEQIIRDDGALERIRQYIQENPAQWVDDSDNPLVWRSEANAVGFVERDRRSQG